MVIWNEVWAEEVLGERSRALKDKVDKLWVGLNIKDFPEHPGWSAIA